MNLREELAAMEHARWAHWQAYLHSRCSIGQDGSLSIPPELVERWEHQIGTPYALLSESEKDSDRRLADKYLALVQRQLRVPQLVDLLHRLGATDALWEDGLAKACEVALSNLDKEPSEDAAQLGELLAVVHRDGGHYQDQHGTHKAVKAAMEIVSSLRLHAALPESHEGASVPTDPLDDDPYELMSGMNFE
jgi:hypothetical protein